MTRNYPLYLVDRSRIKGHEFDFVVCTDRKYGYIARVVQFRSTELLDEFEAEAAKIPDSDISNYVLRLSKGGLALVVEEFMYYFDIDDDARTHLHSMLKKGMKKYYYSTTREHDTDLETYDIDQQIRQQIQTIERARSQYDDLVKRSSVKEAAYAIRLAESTLQTLQRYKDLEGHPEGLQ